MDRVISPQGKVLHLSRKVKIYSERTRNFPRAAFTSSLLTPMLTNYQMTYISPMHFCLLKVVAWQREDLIPRRLFVNTFGAIKEPAGGGAIKYHVNKDIRLLVRKHAHKHNPVHVGELKIERWNHTEEGKKNWRVRPIQQLRSKCSRCYKCAPQINKEYCDG